MGLKNQLLRRYKSARSLYIFGPRQSGKTTLAKECFPDLLYVNLENPDTLENLPNLYSTLSTQTTTTSNTGSGPQRHGDYYSTQFGTNWRVNIDGIGEFEIFAIQFSIIAKLSTQVTNRESERSHSLRFVIGASLEIDGLVEEAASELECAKQVENAAHP